MAGTLGRLCFSNVKGKGRAKQRHGARTSVFDLFHPLTPPPPPLSFVDRRAVQRFVEYLLKPANSKAFGVRCPPAPLPPVSPRPYNARRGVSRGRRAPQRAPLALLRRLLTRPAPPRPASAPPGARRHPAVRLRRPGDGRPAAALGELLAAQAARPPPRTCRPCGRARRVALSLASPLFAWRAWLAYSTGETVAAECCFK